MILKLRYLSLLAIVAASLSCSVEEESEFVLRYDKPAAEWVEALPVGNGTIGAMIFGDPQKEHIQFNEETLWKGEPHSYAHEGAYEYLDTIRNLLFENKQVEANAIALRETMSIPLRQKAYQPFGDVYIEFPEHKEYSNYQRKLDLNNAVSSVSYTAEGIDFKREFLVSHPDKTIAINISANKKKSLNFNLILSSIQEDHKVSIDGNVLSMDVKVQDGVLRGTARLALNLDEGKFEKVNNTLKVSGATAATIYLTAATSFVSFEDVSGNPENESKNYLEKIIDKKYGKLKADHIADYQEMFNRFSIDFGENENAKLPTDQRIINFWKTADDPQLVALYVQFARYLTLASSRAGSNASTLIGLWNHRIKPSWEGKYTTNINTEMNYWPVEVTNLSECHDPLFDLISDCSKTGAEVAKVHYNANGWVLHHCTDLWRGAAPINSTAGIWVTGAAWTCQHLWEHYEFTQDEDFLENKAYPLMKGAAQFFVDFLVEDPNTGWLVSSPSTSPEIGGLVAGPTMDHQIIRALFRNCIKTAELLDIDTEFKKILEEKLAKIAPNQIGKHGQLQEWMQDIDDPNEHHRHVSHLWGLHPGNEINWKDTKDVYQAAKKSLEFRGDDGTGWSLAWKINFWARFLDGEHTYKMIHMLLSPAEHKDRKSKGGTYPNMFDAHPSFQIDGNFGGAAGITELLLQSHLGELHLLPALPKALSNGSVKGICARGGFELDMTWNQAQLNTLKIFSKAGKTCKLRLGDNIVEFPTQKGKTYKMGVDFNFN